ncbi:hypothetical protein [Actinomadura miaoliensis]|uniref:DUF3592 domain-containing protein n=1 Tax=Actinomadura miaoliensis TaxID=430685 RepID=A0ABP7X0Z1_9ACTN
MAVVLTALLVQGATALVLLLDTRLHRTEKFGRIAQPATVTYEDDRRHYVGVVRERSWIFGRHQAYRLYAGGSPDLGYGHFVRLEFLGVDRPVPAGADWRRDGVRVRFTSGHEVFVPARYFLGGR